ncbi:MAG: AMP-binding protein [Candidatus Aureabacteria bacterium]|nr:AMP-binding protein [Candidatus Auribacterota bacterium]
MNKETLPVFLHDLMKREDTFIRGYINGGRREISGKEFCLSARAMAHFLRSKGVSQNDRVAVIAEKCPESIISFFSIWMSGGIAVPVCETLKSDELEYILLDSGSKVVLCGSSLEKKISSLQSQNKFAIISFDKVLAEKSPSVSDEIFCEPEPDDAAFLIYTSGSTGRSKGVILTHRNIHVNAKTSAEYIRMKKDDAVMSILPYWHSFALTAEVFTMLHVGGCICIPQDKSTFLKDIALFHPTIILSIPRLAEMLKRGIESSIEKKSSLQKKIFHLARKVCLRYHEGGRESRRRWLRLLYSLFRRIVFQKVKDSLGGRIRYFIGGGAPLDVSLQQFFFSIDLPMYQGYGLTEASPVISINAPHDFKMGTSGKIIPWMSETFDGGYCFEDDTGRRAKNIHGELLVKGPCVMKGYWDLEEETRHVLKDGWLCTGDLGYLDGDSYLVLAGRKKNLICLTGGEKFCPEFIEERIKSSSYIEQAVIVGDGCKRCSVVINVSTEKAAAHTEEELASLLSREIRYLTEGFEEFQRPLRHLVLPVFTAENGMLTSTQKVRRHVVLEKYRQEIEEFLQKN